MSFCAQPPQASSRAAPNPINMFFFISFSSLILGNKKSIQTKCPNGLKSRKIN
ncbi:hypothetical protein HMPREF3199_00267 [Enterococcus faecium]|nr:hypothetical protein HMPREF3199_00267 [Enterococcus faecium]